MLYVIIKQLIDFVSFFHAMPPYIILFDCYEVAHREFNNLTSQSLFLTAATVSCQENTEVFE